MMRKSLALATLLALSQTTLASDETTWLDRITGEIQDTWTRGTNEYYATFRTWHLPWSYTREQNKEYQNWPVGFGAGRGYFDDADNWHGLYAMGFQDSHFKPQWIVGYGWKTYWTVGEGFKLGLGYTAGLTARADIAHYLPVPCVLPIGSIEKGKFSLEGTYVPGGKGYGNVMMFWLKWRTDSKDFWGW